MKKERLEIIQCSHNLGEIKTITSATKAKVTRNLVFVVEISQFIDDNEQRVAKKCGLR